MEEGGWQSRITGSFGQEDLDIVRSFAHVRDAVFNGEGNEAFLDIYFDDMGDVLTDTPLIAEMLGASPDDIAYHYPLLSMYLIRDSRDTAPRLVFPLFLLITAMASFSLIVIIHNAFAVSMNARIHQFGIFSSVGATPKQIRSCLLQEAAMLCAVPVLAGNLLGIAGSMGLMLLTNILLGDNVPGRHEAVPGYHPLVFILTLIMTIITIWISAWLPAKKLSRLTSLEAIKNTGELQLKRKKNSPLAASLFGVEGELAGNALKAQRKALRTASLSLLFSFMAFTMMQCFFTLSDISTKETYFERYQDVWDIMATVKDTGIEAFGETVEIQGLPGVESAILYQRARAKTVIAEDEISEEMKSFGGFSQASDAYVTKTDDGWLVNAPILIMDDNSFLAWCGQLGIAPRLDGAVVINQIRDVTNPDFRHPDLMPYLRADAASNPRPSILRQPDSQGIEVEIPVLSYIKQEEAPGLREEYATLDYYELVHFIPMSLWKEIIDTIDAGIQGPGALPAEMNRQAWEPEDDFNICILAGGTPGLEELNALQSEVERLLDGKYAAECENRIQELETNHTQIQGMKALFGGFCVLLAVIGIGNIFSNTLGFVRQRKREFVRYMSIGITPKELRKMFCVEALALAGRPLLITLPLAVAAVGYMLKMSYVSAGEFLAEAPLPPIIIFMLAIAGSVSLAYAFAWRNVSKISLAEVLKDDTMM